MISLDFLFEFLSAIELPFHISILEILLAVLDCEEDASISSESNYWSLDDSCRNFHKCVSECTVSLRLTQDCTRKRWNRVVLIFNRVNKVYYCEET